MPMRMRRSTCGYVVSMSDDVAEYRSKRDRLLVEVDDGEAGQPATAQPESVLSGRRNEDL